MCRLRFKKKWEVKIVLGRWAIQQGSTKAGKELDALEKLSEDQHGYTRQMKRRDGQEHVGNVGQESKHRGLIHW